MKTLSTPSLIDRQGLTCIYELEIERIFANHCVLFDKVHHHAMTKYIQSPPLGEACDRESDALTTEAVPLRSLVFRHNAPYDAV